MLAVESHDVELASIGSSLDGQFDSKRLAGSGRAGDQGGAAFAEGEGPSQNLQDLASDTFQIWSGDWSQGTG